MSFWLRLLATIETTWEWLRRTTNTLRTRVFVPNVIHAGYNMILTQAGYWTPVHSRAQSESGDGGMAFYDAVAHRVSVSNTPAAWSRWEWIGAVGCNGTDYGDFFAELRVERGRVLTPAHAIALAVHQSGRWPGTTLRATTRMGDEIEVSANTGLSCAPHRADESTIDYIR